MRKLLLFLLVGTLSIAIACSSASQVQSDSGPSLDGPDLPAADLLAGADTIADNTISEGGSHPEDVATRPGDAPAAETVVPPLDVAADGTEVVFIDVQEVPLDVMSDLADIVAADVAQQPADITPDLCPGDCSDQECGDDGCGGNCGVCTNGYECDNGLCVNNGICLPVPKPAPAAPEPLPAMSPAGQTETITANGFTDDYLFDGTGYLKVGTRREWGATIVFFGMTEAGPGMNLSNTIDANDTGREVQVAFYDAARIMQGCAWNASCQTNPGAACPSSITYLGWNPVQGGNQCNIGSGIKWVNAEPGVLEAGVQPRHWNPDWEMADCSDGGCNDPNKKQLVADVLYTQRLRFVSTHVVEMQMTVENLAAIDHVVTHQEFPTLYAVYGKNGTANLNVLLDSDGNQIAIDQPANDGFFVKNFSSDGGWATLQNGTLDYGVAIYYENRLTGFQGWQKAGVFNNVRSVFAFGIPALATVRARAYLVLGGYDTVAGIIKGLDATLPPFGTLESPILDAQVGENMAVSGWALDNKGVASLMMTVDGQQFAPLPLNTERADVCAMYPGYSQCGLVGFSHSVSTTGLSPCPHLLEVVATDTDGNSRVIARTRITLGEVPPECQNDADCDNSDPCTADTCAAGKCLHAPQPCLPDTVTIYRYFLSGGNQDHMFGTSPNPPQGYAFEGAQFELFDGEGPGLIPLYQLYCSGCVNHLQSTSPNEGAPAYQSEGILGYCAANASPETPHALRRLYNAQASDHFVSINTEEWSAAQSVGYVLEGVLCYTP